MAEHDIPGPDWSDAPSWANPGWIWYSQGTTFEEDRSVRPGQGIDYRQTLRSRPEVQND